MYQNAGGQRGKRGFFMEGATPQLVKARQQMLGQQMKEQQSSQKPDGGPSPVTEPKPKQTNVSASSNSMSEGWKSELGLVQSRPSNPLETALSDEELFATLPNHVQKTVHAVTQSVTASDAQIEMLRKFIHQAMIDGGNPFLVVKSYQKKLGGQIKRVLDQDTMDYLDHYWEHWSAPPPLQPPTEAAPASSTTEPQAVTRAPPPPPPVSDSPPLRYTFSTDPLLVRADQIPGVMQDGRGNIRGTNDTMQWIRLIIGLYQRKGEEQPVVAKFAQKMAMCFGEELVTQAILRADEDSKKDLEFASDQQLPFGIQRVGQNDDDELIALRGLTQNMAFSDLPGIQVAGGKSQFSYETVTWIQLKLSRMLIRGLNPDPFVRKLFEMCGEDNLCRAMTEDYVQWLKKEIGRSKGSGGNFLEWLIAEVVSSPPKIAGTTQEQIIMGTLPERTRSRRPEGSTPKKGKFDYSDKPAFAARPGNPKAPPAPLEPPPPPKPAPLSDYGFRSGPIAQQPLSRGPPIGLMSQPMSRPDLSIGGMMARQRALIEAQFEGDGRGPEPDMGYGRGMNQRSLTGLDRPMMGMGNPRSLLGDYGDSGPFQGPIRGMGSRMQMGPSMGGPGMGGPGMGDPGMGGPGMGGPPDMGFSGGMRGRGGGPISRGPLRPDPAPLRGPRPLAKYEGPLFNTPARLNKMTRGKPRGARAAYKE